MEKELIEALRELLNYTGGWDIDDKAHPIYKARHVLEKAEAKTFEEGKEK